jgi:hypothetical protein
MSQYQKFISTSIVLTVIIGGVAGAVIGHFLDGIFIDKLLLAVTAAFLAVLVAAVVRHFTVFALVRDAGPGPGPLVLPGIAFVNAATAAFFGGLAAYGLSWSAIASPPSAWIGCLSGVIASVTMELLMIGYRARSSMPGSHHRSS